MNLPRKGFTLIETIIVILILGIITAVAAPSVFNTATTAEENTTQQKLKILRNAIDMYHTRAGVYPAQLELPNAMATMLNGPFPAPSIGSALGDDGVYYDLDADASVPVAPDQLQDGGWAYKPANGTLRLNLNSGETGYDW